jgi:hypothetical protein
MGRINKLKLSWLLASCGFLSSCGYYHEMDQEFLRYHTYSIDPIAEDWNGDLTAALVEAMAATSQIAYRPCGGEMILQIHVEDPDEKNIGFRYDHHRDGKIRKSIIPTETRLTICAEVTVTEAATNTALMGPVRLTTSVDFDHDYYTTYRGVNIFSLGQLNDYDEAYDAAYSPLIKALANRIVDYIAEAW